MKKNTTQITFSPPLGGTLRFCLDNLNIYDPVISLTDSLNYGPINELFGQQRIDFLQQVSYFYLQETIPDIEEMKISVNNFWEKALDANPKTVWFSSRSAIEMCGLMMFLERIESTTTVSYIDINHYDKYKDIISTGKLSVEALAELLPRVKLMTNETRERYIQEWNTLKQHSSKPLRWMTVTGLVASDWSPVNKVLLELIGIRKRKMMEVIGEAVGKLSESYHNVSDVEVSYCLSQMIKRGFFISTQRHLMAIEPTTLVWKGNRG